MIVKFSERLFADLTKDLNAHALEEGQVIKRLERSVHTCLKYLRKLKDYWKQSNPSTTADEINFFKKIKPKFKSQLIFYQSLLHIELRRPIGEGRVVCEYLANELKILQHFFESNLSFYQYVRTEASYLDESYFVRGAYDVHLDPDQCVIDFDPTFSTTHDHKLAQVLASELLQDHIEHAIMKINQRDAIIQTDTAFGDFDWKQTKCALIELIYSWHATEAFGKKNLKSIVKFIERAFNVSLGNFYDTFEWLSSRQSPTLYLDEMKAALTERIEKKFRLG